MTKDQVIEALRVCVEALQTADNIALVGSAYSVKAVGKGFYKIQDAIKQANEAICEAKAVEPERQPLPISATPEMIAAAEEVEDLYRRGTPETWGKVWRAMLAAAPAQPERKPLTWQPIETAWLAEYDGKWLSTMTSNPSHVESIQYLCIEPIHGEFGRVKTSTTSDATKAIRFSRKEDAELAIKLHVNEPSHYDQNSYAKHWSATEHMWPSAALPEAPARGITGGQQ